MFTGWLLIPDQNLGFSSGKRWRVNYNLIGHLLVHLRTVNITNSWR